MTCRALFALGLAGVLAGCSTTSPTGSIEDTRIGEAKARTMAAQIVNPDPHYEGLDPATSGQHATAAIERYRKDAVKKPERISSTLRNGGGSNGN